MGHKLASLSISGYSVSLSLSLSLFVSEMAGDICFTDIATAMLSHTHLNHTC